MRAVLARASRALGVGALRARAARRELARRVALAASRPGRAAGRRARARPWERRAEDGGGVRMVLEGAGGESRLPARVHRRGVPSGD